MPSNTSSLTLSNIGDGTQNGWKANLAASLGRPLADQSTSEMSGTAYPSDEDNGSTAEQEWRSRLSASLETSPLSETPTNGSSSSSEDEMPSNTSSLTVSNIGDGTQNEWKAKLAASLGSPLADQSTSEMSGTAYPSDEDNGSTAEQE